MHAAHLFCIARLYLHHMTRRLLHFFCILRLCLWWETIASKPVSHNVVHAVLYMLDTVCDMSYTDLSLVPACLCCQVINTALNYHTQQTNITQLLLNCGCPVSV
jgi:hypothetical protein